MIRQRVKSNKVQQLLDAGGSRGAIDAVHAEAKGDVLGNREMREQLLVLKHQTDVAAVRRPVGDVATIERHRAAVGDQQPSNHTEKCALAAPRWAEQGDHFAAGDFQRHVIEHSAIAEGDGDFIRREHNHLPWIE